MRLTIVLMTCVLACSARRAVPSLVVDGASAHAPDSLARHATGVSAATTAGITAPAAVGAALPDIIVGSARGLEAWRRDGSGKRVISPGLSRSPRWLDESSVVVVASRDRKNPENLASGATLERVSLVDGSRKRIATLPRFVCNLKPDAVDAPDPSTMAIQSADDFIIDVDNRHACMTLMDRNLDMVSVWLDIRVDLVNGHIQRWLTIGGQSCVPSAGVKVVKEDETSGPRCKNASEGSSRDSTPSPFEFTESGILKERGQGGARILRVPGYGVNSGFDASPSGRWSVLRGDVEEGDYIHARLLLLDRDKGELFRIAENRSWPPPLRPKGKHGLPQIKTPVDTIDVVGESDVRWLGSSAESELLVVDSLVVKPGHFAFGVDGEIAR